MKTSCDLVLVVLCVWLAQTAAHGAERQYAPPTNLGPTWVEIDGQSYGARADDVGPIGGGRGYSRVVSKGDYTARNIEQLVQALKNAESGQVVLIPRETEIDLTALIYVEKLVLDIPAGVTLAGNRGHNGSRGALLTSDALDTPVMIQAAGPNVRVTGLRIRGPNTKRYLDHYHRAFRSGGGGHAYYYRFPKQNAIQTRHDGLEVDNCDLSGFGRSAVDLASGKEHHIHHNFIHHCQYNGLGYGVLVGTASSLIEQNLFDWNRHSIAGTGRPGCSYVARHNVELGTSLSHCFDMHGGRDREDGSDVAGTSIEIHNNTFRANQTPVFIRGVPQDACEVHHNWFFAHVQPSKAVRAAERTNVFDNAYGPRRPFAR